MKLPLTEITSSQFFYDKPKGRFIIEMSCLRNPDLFRRMYDDAADIGFTMISARTGTKVRYYLARRDTDKDGSTAAWVFEPADKAGMDTSVVVFND